MTYLGRVLLLLMPLCTAGCAAAYHDYECGQVGYRYCVPPPLPYRLYDACPTPIAACYEARSAAAAPSPAVGEPQVETPSESSGE